MRTKTFYNRLLKQKIIELIECRQKCTANVSEYNDCLVLQLLFDVYLSKSSVSKYGILEIESEKNKG